jgi:hypothetical protein
MKPNEKLGFAVGVGVALTFASQGFAAEWVTNIPVTQTVVGNSGGEYVQILTSSTIVNPASCASGDSYVVRDPALVKSALAIGLTAIAADRQIRVYVSDTCDAATGRPMVTAVGLM